MSCFCSAELLSAIEVFKCWTDSNCDFCGNLGSALAGTWISVECANSIEELPSLFVRLAINSQSEVREDLFICEVNIIGSKFWCRMFNPMYNSIP